MRVETMTALARAVDAVADATSMVRVDETNVLKEGDLVGVITHFHYARQALDQMKECRKALEDMIDRLSVTSIPELFRDQGVKTINVERVGRVTVSYRFACSMLDKPGAFGWLRANEQGGLIQDYVHPQTLAAHAKDMMESKGEQLPVELFKTSMNPYTSITKAK